MVDHGEGESGGEEVMALVVEPPSKTTWVWRWGGGRGTGYHDK